MSKNPLITIKIRTGRIKNQETGDWEQRIVRGSVPIEKAKSLLTPAGFAKAMDRRVLDVKDLRFEAFALAAEGGTYSNPFPFAAVLGGLAGGLGSALGGHMGGALLKAKNPGVDPTAVDSTVQPVRTKNLGMWQATQMNPHKTFTFGASCEKLPGSRTRCDPRYSAAITQELLSLPTRSTKFYPSTKRDVSVLFAMEDLGLIRRAADGISWMLTADGEDAYFMVQKRKNPAAPSAMSDAQTRAALRNPLRVNPKDRGYGSKRANLRLELKRLISYDLVRLERKAREDLQQHQDKKSQELLREVRAEARRRGLLVGEVGEHPLNAAFGNPLDPGFEARHIAAGTYSGQTSYYNPVSAQFAQRPLPVLSDHARSILKVEMDSRDFWQPWTQRQMQALGELKGQGLVTMQRAGWRLTKRGVDIRRKMNLRGRTENPEKEARDPTFREGPARCEGCSRKFSYDIPPGRLCRSCWADYYGPNAFKGKVNLPDGSQKNPLFEIRDMVSIPALDSNGIIKSIDRTAAVGLAKMLGQRPFISRVSVKLSTGDTAKFSPRSIRLLNPR